MIIEVKDVMKKYKELIALDSFSLQVKEGEIYGLLGPNGSGKTTAINCILSLIPYEKGEIKLFGEPMSAKRYDLKQNIGYVPQSLAFMPELKVWENIDFFSGLYIKDKAKRREMIEEVIDFVGLESFRNFLPKKLSGGLKRRLNIACGIAHKPKLIFMDEPTVAVDPQSRNNILEGVKKLAESGVTIIYTTHYMEEVEELCNKISIMDKGHVLIEGTKESLKDSVGLKDKIIFKECAIVEVGTKEEISKIHNVVSVENKDNDLIATISNKSALSSLFKFLEEKEIHYSSILFEQPTLNDVFLEITGKELRDN